MSVKYQRVKFRTLKINLKASSQIKKILKEGWLWRENKWREEKKVRKEDCVGKVGKYLNLYSKQSDLTHAYFYDMPMILLLYKEVYFNTNELDFLCL
jgi:hypothetical protein